MSALRSVLACRAVALGIGSLTAAVVASSSRRIGGSARRRPPLTAVRFEFGCTGGFASLSLG